MDERTGAVRAGLAENVMALRREIADQQTLLRAMAATHTTLLEQRDHARAWCAYYRGTAHGEYPLMPDLPRRAGDGWDPLS